MDDEDLDENGTTALRVFDKAMDSEQFELIWGFHIPETSEDFWRNVQSALNLKN